MSFKLKRLTLPQTLGNFGLKINKLNHSKWKFLKQIARSRRFRFWFLNPGKFSMKSGQKKVRLSFLRQINLVRLSRLFFGGFRLRFFKKNVLCKASKVSKQRSLQVFNLLERRLVVLLVRAGFFDRISKAAQAIKEGSVYVNNRRVKSPFFLVALHDLVDIRNAKSRAKIRYELKLKKISFLAAKLRFNSRNSLRNSLSNNRQVRLKSASYFVNILRELFLLDDFYRPESKRFLKTGAGLRNKRIFWPAFFSSPCVPTYLLVDFTSLVFCLKSTVSTVALSTFFQQKLYFTELWRL